MAMLFCVYLFIAAYAKVLIIGGGPVGLYAGVRLREKGVEVCIVEKRAEYSRAQLFSLSDEHEPFKSISLLSDQVISDLWTSEQAHGSVMFWPSISQHAQVHLQVPVRETRDHLNYYGSVPISEFERSLRQEFLRLSGQLILGEAKVSPDGTVTVNGEPFEFEYTHLICADGRSSACRRALFDPLHPQILLGSQGEGQPDGYGVTVVIGAANLPEKLREATLTHQPYQDSVLSQHRYRAFLSKRGQWYLGIGLSRAEYEEWKGIPLGANEPLWREIKAALSYYRLCECSDADRLRRHFSLSFFPITVAYQPVNGFARLSEDGQRLYAVMGDSAYGTHFFTGTGLNAGLFLANSLVEAIEERALSQQVAHMNRMGKFITEYNIPWAQSICEWLQPNNDKVFGDDDLEEIKAKLQDLLPAGFMNNANERTLRLMAKNLHTYQARFHKLQTGCKLAQPVITIRAPIIGGEGIRASITIARLQPHHPVSDPAALIAQVMEIGGAPEHGFVGIKLTRLPSGLLIGEGSEFEEFYHRIYRAFKQQSLGFDVIFGLPTVEDLSDICKQDYLVDLSMAHVAGLPSACSPA